MKKILFIANKGYSKIIIEKLEQLGYEVDYFNDKPNDGFMSKSLGRFRVSFYEKVLTKYYLDILDKTSKKIYDYVFMIRGEYITEDALRAYNDYFSSAKKILYMWDSVANCKGIEKKWKFFDEVYTFDRKDYHKYKEDYLKFLPLFYADQYRNQKITSHNEYDIAFIELHMVIDR